MFECAHVCSVVWLTVKGGLHEEVRGLQRNSLFLAVSCTSANRYPPPPPLTKHTHTDTERDRERSYTKTEEVLLRNPVVVIKKKERGFPRTFLSALLRTWEASKYQKCLQNTVIFLHTITGAATFSFSGAVKR